MNPKWDRVYDEETVKLELLLLEMQEKWSENGRILLQGQTGGHPSDAIEDVGDVAGADIQS
jgi:hypothetical protein